MPRFRRGPRRVPRRRGSAPPPRRRGARGEGDAAAPRPRPAATVRGAGTPARRGRRVPGR
ncbi:hypothetical protein DB347_06345 [Opitutaceae bacterium EW11]|nr:hypothetical protein DB347_06345 [Opitutaceae bacterium EW11]